MDGTDEIHAINDTGTEDVFAKSSFIFREGLCGNGEYISMESFLYPGKFWRHQNNILKLHERADDDLFKEDACFKMTKHLCSLNYVSESISFYSRNFPDKLITKCGNQLKIESESDSCGDPENHCWVLDSNFVQIVAVSSVTESTAYSVITTNKNDNSIILADNDESYQVHLFSQFRVVEGLDGNSINKTVSLESHAKPGFYLYVDAVDSPFHLNVGPDDGSGDFTARASWLTVVDGLYCQFEHMGHALASAANPKYYLAYCQNELMMVLVDGSWTRCSGEEDFNLNENGCWYLNRYKNEFRVDLFKAEGAHGPRWIHEQVQYVPEDPDYELWFIAESGNSDPDNWGDIAIDDITGYYGECQQQNICTFEDSKACGFAQEEEDLTDWTVGNFVDDPSGSAPPADHTSRGQMGRTVYYQNDLKTKTSFDSQIRSPQYPPLESACVSFWYYMWSTDYQEEMELSVLTTLSNNFTLWSRRGWIKQGWVRGTVDLVTDQAMQVVFRARGQNLEDRQITIAFDDYEIDTENFCSTMDRNMGCDFETEDTCKWSNSENDDLDWVIGSGHTDTSDTGPGADHTTQTGFGHYLYIAEKSSGTRNKYAVLESSVVDVTGQDGPACFTFWYHMFGVDIGSLLVNKVDTITQEQKQVFNKFASQGNAWRFGEIQIDPDANIAYLYMQIMAVTNNGERGEIAIDDIFLVNGPCTNPVATNFSCSSEEQVPMEVVCDFNKDCSNGKDESNCGECDFEHNQCGWTVPSIPSKYNWMRKQNGSDSGNGPMVDHTTGTDQGWFMIADQTEDEEYVYQTYMVGPVLRQTFSTCEINLWYYFTKDDVHSVLSVYGQIGVEAMTRYWFTYSGKAEWRQARVHLGRQRSPLVVIMEARFGEGKNIMAVDDIKLQACEFPQPPEEGCNADQYTCKNDACFEKSQKCDLTDDCGDNSDEEDSDCSDYITSRFEESLSSWGNLDDDSADFKISNSLDTSIKRRPTRDHTTNTQYGGFLAADIGDITDSKRRVRLASQVLTSLGQSDCSIAFYLYLYHEGVKNKIILNTREAFGGEESQIFNHTEGGPGDFWFKEFVTIPEGMKAFQIVLELQINANKSADMFIDDISISPSCKTDETSLPTLPSTTSTTSDPCYFRCGDNQCLEQPQVCNFHQDCPDGKDESACGTCQFEQWTCGWEDASASLYGWERARPTDLADASFTYPTMDRKNQTDKYYMIADVQSPGSSPEPALLMSPLIGGSAASCKIKFWYSKVDSETNLNFKMIQDGQVVKVLSISRRDENWSQETISLNLVGSYQLEFEAVYNAGTEAINAVAVDDIVFKDCDSQNPPEIHVDCNWENDLCSWTQATGLDDADWERTNEGAWFEGTGPGYDHTSGSGYYLYFTSQHHQPGQKAILSTPPIGSTKQPNSCLSFWYHIYGLEFDTLNLNINQKTESITLWTLSSSQGNLWKQAFVDVPSGQKEYMVIVFNQSYFVLISIPKLEFEGIAGNAETGHVALDDLSYSVGEACSPSAGGLCDLQVGLCHWANVNGGEPPEDEGDWMISRNGTGNPGDGPR